MTEFKPGEKVISDFGTSYTVEFGPVNVAHTPHYALYREDGTGSVVAAARLSPAEPEAPDDPRIEVVARVIWEENNGDAFAWESADSDFRSSYLKDAVKILSALDAMEPHAVIDQDGDRWEQDSNGTYTMVRRPDDYHSWAYESVRITFGPLSPAA